MTDDFSFDSRRPWRPRINKLTNSKVTEISLVPEGMNEHARLLFSKSFDGGEPGGAMSDLILKSAGGVLTEADLLISVTRGEASVAAICKALDARQIDYRVSVDPDIVTKIWKRYGDHRSEAERNVAGASLFAKAMQIPLRPNEKLRGFVARIGKSRVLYPLDRLVIEAAYTLHKRKAAVSKRHNAEFAKGVDTLDSIAKRLQAANPGWSFAKAYTEATKSGDGARLSRKLQETRSHALATVQDAMFKGVVRGPGFDTPAADPDNSGDGSGDDGEAGDHWSPEDMADAYAADDVTDEAGDGIYHGPRSLDGEPGGGSRARGGRVDNDNLANADDDEAQLVRCAENIRKSSGFKLSKAQALTRAYAALPEIYKSWRAKGGGR